MGATGSIAMTNRTGLLLAISLMVVSSSVDAQGINQRKTTAQATIAGSHNLYDGSFAATGISSICGEIPKFQSLTGTAVYVIEFPYDPLPNATIQSIAFGSSKLVGGVTKTTVFRLSIAVVTANGGRPYAYVLNTDPVTPKNTGTATLTKKGKVATLAVRGQNERGETIRLTVSCM